MEKEVYSSLGIAIMANIYILITDITKSAGTERAVCNLANIISGAEKYSVSIISVASVTGTAYYPINGGVNIIHLGINVFVKCVPKKLVAYKAVERKMRRIINDDSILIGTDVPYNALITRFKRCRTIGCSHMGGRTRLGMRGLATFFAYRKLDRFIVLTEADKRNYHHLKRVFVIPNSLSFAPSKKDDYSKNSILAIGRLSPQKGFDLLIDVATKVLQELPSWSFTICGTGADEEKLLAKIRSVRLENAVRIIAPTKDVISLYHSASIYAMTSRYEGLPMVLIEAQSCGLPVVSFDCPEGPAAIVHDGEDGFLVEPGNIEQFSDKLLYLMRDINLREQFGQKAFEHSADFSPERIATLWFSLLDDLEHSGFMTKFTQKRNCKLCTRIGKQTMYDRVLNEEV